MCPINKHRSGLGVSPALVLAAFRELLAPKVDMNKDGTIGCMSMEVSWMLIHTPEAESLCFFRHRDRKCHLPSVMTHCQCVDVYFFLKKK